MFFSLALDSRFFLIRFWIFWEYTVKQLHFYCRGCVSRKYFVCSAHVFSIIIMRLNSFMILKSFCSGLQNYCIDQYSHGAFSRCSTSNFLTKTNSLFWYHFHVILFETAFLIIFSAIWKRCIGNDVTNPWCSNAFQKSKDHSNESHTFTFSKF